MEKYGWAIGLVFVSLAGCFNSTDQAPPSQPVLPDAGACSITNGTLTFSGMKWDVRNQTGDPGPNRFDPANVACDALGNLHLRISKRGEEWTAAEVMTQDLHGFGTYQFQLEHNLTFDRKVVLGLYLYKERTADSYNEIDIEFGASGGPRRGGSWTVYYPKPMPMSPQCDLRDSIVPGPDFVYEGCSHAFIGNISQPDARSTQRFTWRTDEVVFEEQPGWADTGAVDVWSFRPSGPTLYIPQTTMYLRMNLWTGLGRGPLNGQPVDVTVHAVAAPPPIKATSPPPFGALGIDAPQLVTFPNVVALTPAPSPDR